MEQTKMENPKDDLDAFSQGEAEAEARGGDHRPIQDNGTQGFNSNVQGAPSGNTFPAIPDRHARSEQSSQGEGYEISDFGLNENAEVGHNGNQLCYGIEGPAAGGGKEKNTKV